MDSVKVESFQNLQQVVTISTTYGIGQISHIMAITLHNGAESIAIGNTDITPHIKSNIDKNNFLASVVR